MAIAEKLGAAAKNARDMAVLRNFVATVDQRKRPSAEALRLVASILRRAAKRAEKRGPKPYFELFFDFFGPSSSHSPRAAQYVRMFRATKSQITAGRTQSAAIAFVAEQMGVSLDTVRRVWKAYNEYTQALEAIISDEEDPPVDEEFDNLLAALAKLKRRI